MLVVVAAVKRGWRPHLACRTYRSISHFSSDSSNRSLSPASQRLREAGPARTRFAPSPTGYLHLGSLRTALFNYLIAKATGGQFILRIEDTDQSRTIEDAEHRLFEDLEWAGLEWDEGPNVGGPFGPYKQSQRLSIYKQHVDDLLLSGHAYRCFCTQERLHELAQHRGQSGQPPAYDRTCAHIHRDQSDEKAAHGEAHAVRLLAPERYPAYEDLIFKEVRPRFDRTAKKFLSQGTRGSFDDPILLKTDGYPTYHLANVVDDHLMKITHVIRGSEWINSTPKHMWMYKAFGWEPPKFGHVSLLTDKNGHKLSKREGAIDVRSMRDDLGVFPETLTNFVALLGWSHDQKSDVMSLEDLIKHASLKFTKGDTTVSFEKMWFLQKKHAVRYATASSDDVSTPPDQDLQLLAAGPVFKYLKSLLSNNGDLAFYKSLSEAQQKQLVSKLVKADAQNYTSAPEFIGRNITFFQAPTADMLQDGLPKMKDATKDLRETYDLDTFNSRLDDFQDIPTGDWNVNHLKESIDKIINVEAPKDSNETFGAHSKPQSAARKVWPTFVHGYLRWAISAGRPGPDGSLTMALLGKEESMRRLGLAKSKLFTAS
ncbi:Nucleotidylyl transferase [Glarea lozoyensis ATCC 20868]|uniref:Glutamate--tRNA ligase, mitochondrial n=1 Tax=Glarea lozoyensis (strain ATCC 20868 / MF5171) TaxID=1116229 RepID=S3CX94_GLAL2|nr:Nucleotidylyl transferase [Glarea lozoyensis ATCC 20868]EPE29554.1 Nucleotidylyl transferase [Glarea lozoyensis ATCC 20868]